MIVTAATTTYQVSGTAVVLVAGEYALPASVYTLFTDRRRPVRIPSGRMSRVVLLRGTILNRTYGLHKNLYISLFLLTIFGPIYYGPP